MKEEAAFFSSTEEPVSSSAVRCLTMEGAFVLSVRLVDLLEESSSMHFDLRYNLLING